MLVHNCLVGTGRDPEIRLGARQVASGVDHRQADHSGCRLHPVCPHHDVCDRLHSGDEVPHQQVPHRRGHSGQQALARALYAADKDRPGRQLPARNRIQCRAGNLLHGAHLLRRIAQPSILNRASRASGQARMPISGWLMPGELLRIHAAGIVAVGLDRSVVRRVSLKRVIKGGVARRPVQTACG